MTTDPVLAIETVALGKQAKAVSLDLFPGDAYAVMGQAGSGRRAFIEAITGGSKPTGGSLSIRGAFAGPRVKDYSRRHTPLVIAKSLNKHGSSARLTQVLDALGLWEHRQDSIASFEPEMVAACDLLEVLVPQADLCLIDGQLDCLDPWARKSTLSLIDDWRKAGAAFVVSTNLTTVASALGSLIVFQGFSPVYAGSVPDLLRNVAPTELIIESDDPSSIGSMLEPFALFVKQVEGGLLVHSDKGQELAAQLLTRGYGRVKSIVIREPNLAEALAQIV